MISPERTPQTERDTRYYHSVPTPVPIFQREWEWDQCLQLYQERAPMSILEIGTYHGGTLYHWLRLAQPGAHIVSVDRYSEGVDNRHLYEVWVPDGVALSVIAGDSADESTIAAAAAYAPYDWVFIDAGHLEHEVTADWDNYRPMCAPGGVMLLHDIMHSPHDWLQVDRLWERLQHQGYLTQEIACAPDLDWSGIGCIFMS